MEIIEFLQKFFVFLLPGIIGMYLYGMLNIQKEEHYYFGFLKIIMLSFVAYISTDVLFFISKKIFPNLLCNPIDILHYLGASDRVIPTRNAIVSIVFAGIFACIMTKAQCGNWIFRIANKLNITQRTDNKTVWESIFNDSDIIVFRDEITKNVYYGKVVVFSDNSDNREIYLESVKVFDKESNFLYEAEKIYLSRAHDEFVIEIYNYDDI